MYNIYHLYDLTRHWKFLNLTLQPPKKLCIILRCSCKNKLTNTFKLIYYFL